MAEAHTHGAMVAVQSRMIKDGKGVHVRLRCPGIKFDFKFDAKAEPALVMALLAIAPQIVENQVETLLLEETYERS